MGRVLFLFIAAVGAAFSQEIRVEVRGAAGEPIADAHVGVAGPGRAMSDRTGSKGDAAFTLPRPGTYTVSASKDGYAGASRAVDVGFGDRLTIEFVLIAHVSQSVTVTASAETVEAASGQEARATPDRPATLRDALPLIPGVVRTPEGKLSIGDAAEHRNSLLVDGLDATDPATGSFGATVPIDAVVAFNVYKSPFLAEFGRFTSGVVTVETRGGGNQWHWELNDPTPELRLLGGHIRGIRGYTPRLNLSGPVVRDRVFVSEALEYVYKKTPVRTLSYPYNETGRESWNSLTRLDWAASGSQLVTLKVHAAPQRLQYVGLGFYNPQAATPNYRGHEGMADVSHQWTVGGGLLESAVSAGESRARVGAQGDADFVMTPTGNLGNYFLRQDRHTQKVEWLERWTARPVHGHHLKAGVAVLGARAGAGFDSRPVWILGTPLLWPFRAYRQTDWETDAYVQDHWVLSPRWSVDGGLRVERQSIAGVTKAAPRASVAWSPFARSTTVVRAGAGWFYDRVPLAVFGWGARDRSEEFTPRSLAWKFEVEQTVSNSVHVRASYWQGRARRLIVLSPSMVLEADGRSAFRHVEVVSRIAVRKGRHLFVSYVHGQTRSNLNEFNNYLGDFPEPVVRPDVFATARANVPHRFLAWGVLPVTKALEKRGLLQWTRGWVVAPVAEYRTGFPYSLLDARQQYAGVPNGSRYPNFFSLDWRVAKNFAVKDHAVQFSFSMFNVTNHWNPEAVRWNTADPQVGEFLGQRPRRFRVDFDLLF